MSEKPITASEMGHRGGTTRANRYSRAQIRAWGKLGGRPPKLDRATLAKLRKMLRRGDSKAEAAKRLGISVRTLDRYLATDTGRRVVAPEAVTGGKFGRDWFDR